MQVWPDGLALNLGGGQCPLTPPIMGWFLQVTKWLPKHLAGDSVPFNTLP